MESLTKPVTLTQDVTRVLDEIRAGAENALYGAGPDKAEELFAKHIVSLVEGAGLPVLQTMHYRWFLRELARLWRMRKGRDLAFHLELCIRKWVGLGLEPKTLQFLVCESYERLKGKDLTTKTPRHEEETSGSSPIPSPRPLVPSADTTKAPRHEGEGETRALDCGSAAPAFPVRADGPEKAAALLQHSTELRSQSAESVESVDVQARISHPPITPITEDSRVSSPEDKRNLCQSVESVDGTPGPASAKSADDRSRP
jgi:hypothetical protein